MRLKSEEPAGGQSFLIFPSSKKWPVDLRSQEHCLFVFRCFFFHTILGKS